MNPAALVVPSHHQVTRRAAPARTDGGRARSGSAAAAAGPGLVLRRCACGGGCPACRAAKASSFALPINTPGDAFEREADRMADAVMPSAAVPRMEESSAATLRRCACGGSCPSCRKKEEGEELRRDEAGAGGAPGFAPPLVHHVLASPGRPLEARTRGWMEERFGADFGGVRVHDGVHAAESARAVDAHAYAVGSHLVFAAGRYAPGTAAGDRLIAHELAHVVQQGGGARRRLARYRSSSSPNFGKCNGALKEKEYKAGDPWIEQITVRFTAARVESDGDVVPTGKLSATYADKAAGAVTGVDIGGGYASRGLTDEGDFTVQRIEGCGYNDQAVPVKEALPGTGQKYYPAADAANASMSFAIFFNPKQAIHQGSLGTGSLACVHVNDLEKLRRLNFHSLVNKTKVSVSYDAAVRTQACCARYRTMGYMVTTPCGKEKPSRCPKKKADKP